MGEPIRESHERILRSTLQFETTIGLGRFYDRYSEKVCKLEAALRQSGATLGHLKFVCTFSECRGSTCHVEPRRRSINMRSPLVLLPSPGDGGPCVPVRIWAPRRKFVEPSPVLSERSDDLTTRCDRGIGAVREVGRRVCYVE